MWGSGQENCLFMIQQRLWTRTDAVANWKMNENWQVSQGNQSDRIGFQYGNAGEMITWKLLQHISDFSFLRDNGLVCPLGLTRCSASKGKSTKSRMKVPVPEMFINIVVKGLKRLFSQPPFYRDWWSCCRFLLRAISAFVFSFSFCHRFEAVVVVHETSDKSTSHLIKGKKPKWYRNIYKANYISTNICTSNYSLIFVPIMCCIYIPGVGNL